MKSEREIAVSIHWKSIRIQLRSLLIKNSKKILIVLISNDNFWSAQKNRGDIFNILAWGSQSYIVFRLLNMFLSGCSSNFGKKLRRDDDDYENERRYHSDFDKEIVLTVHFTLDADLDPNLTFPRAPANSKEGVTDALTGVTRGIRNSYHL